MPEIIDRRPQLRSHDARYAERPHASYFSQRHPWLIGQRCRDDNPQVGVSFRIYRKVRPIGVLTTGCSPAGPRDGFSVRSAELSSALRHMLQSGSWPDHDTPENKGGSVTWGHRTVSNNGIIILIPRQNYGLFAVKPANCVGDLSKVGRMCD